jgi:hypothetical protein
MLFRCKKKISFFWVFVFSLLLLLGSCIREPLSNELAGVFSSDFFIDEFNTFDDSNWARLNEYFLFSYLSPNNVSVSNGNLVFVIPRNTTSSGGVISKYRFPKGDFAISFLKTNDNSVLDFTLHNSENSVKFFIRIKYDGYTNFVEYGVESPYTNFTSTNSNVVVSYSYHSAKFEVLGSSINYYYDDSLIGQINFDYVPQYLYCRVFSYLSDSTTYFYDRYILVDKFSYQKRR